VWWYNRCNQHSKRKENEMTTETTHSGSAAFSAAPLSGQQFEIQRGNERAIITEVGAGLRSFSHDGHELLDTYTLHELPSGCRGQVLLPWPGRIEDGQYTFAGTREQTPLTEPKLHNAIHGLTRWLNWQPTLHEANRLVMELTLYAQPGYPFVLHLRESYSLTEQGLEVQTTARNIGPAPLPYGAGHHPYFTVGTGLVNDAILHVPARSYFRANERMLPLLPAISVEGTPFDFRAPHPIGDLILDTGYTDLLSEDGWTLVTLSAPAGQPRLTISMDRTHQFLQIFSGDTLDEPARRRGLAIEPYTCAPNAFNNGLGLRTLQPGESFSSVWRVSASL
jgi:aldose 1-epimerase